MSSNWGRCWLYVLTDVTIIIEAPVSANDTLAIYIFPLWATTLHIWCCAMIIPLSSTLKNSVGRKYYIDYFWLQNRKELINIVSSDTMNSCRRHMLRFLEWKLRYHPRNSLSLCRPSVFFSLWKGCLTLTLTAKQCASRLASFVHNSYICSITRQYHTNSSSTSVGNTGFLPIKSLTVILPLFSGSPW
jgi:hypothetical protein